MLNIIIFGPPGAGKGTQADKLVARYNLGHLSTGEVIRSEIKSGSALGKQAEKEMAGGKLVSDELVIGIIREYLSSQKSRKGTIFDGFPRTTPQAEALDKMLGSLGESITLVISLEVEDETLIRRLLKRGLIEGRADDSDEEIIKNRIKVYKAQTEIVKKHYAAQGKLYEINGETGGIDGVAQHMFDIIDKYIR